MVKGAKKALQVIGCGVIAVLLLSPGVRCGLDFLRGDRDDKQTFACNRQLERLGMAFLAYAGDHQSRLPRAETWADDIYPYVKDWRVFHCPADTTDARCSYAMNRRLGGQDLEKMSGPNFVVLLYETAHTGRNPAGNGKDRSLRHRTLIDNPGFHFPVSDNMVRASCFLLVNGGTVNARSFEDSSKVKW